VKGWREPVDVWRRGGRLDSASCGVAGGYLWVTASYEPAPPPLLKALASAPSPPAPNGGRLIVWLGGPTTMAADDGVVRVGDAVISEARRTGAWDALASTIAVLAGATSPSPSP
jgi:hypothetical protein